MSRPLSVFQPTSTSLWEVQDVLADDPSGWLPLGARPAGPRVYRLQLGTLGVQRPVVCTVGTPWRTEEGLWRRLSWYPASDANDIVPLEWALPSFDGELGVHTSPDGGVSLILNGTYDVPGAKFGELLDAAGLSSLARRTAARLLADIASRVAERAAASIG